MKEKMTILRPRILPYPLISYKIVARKFPFSVKAEKNESVKRLIGFIIT